jgi:hypothetical protein
MRCGQRWRWRVTAARTTAARFEDGGEDCEG